MISLTTGLPGAGKTLWTIAYVKALAEKEHRPVFYSGIKDLALDWHEFDAENWMGCPDGSIIVIDECQRIFRPRGSGAKVPEYVSALETHRHHGLDIFLITQHPMLMDANVRRLTERHWHVARRFGFQRATIFEYQSCKDQPLANTANAQRSEWSYPKEVFGYYKSAEIHTVQRRFPVKYLLMLSMIFVSAGLIWFFINRWYKDGEFVVPGVSPPKEQHQQVAGSSVTISESPSVSSDRRAENKPMTVKEYVEHYQPRIEGLAYTAPAYDKVTEPEEAPVPVACLTSERTGCLCYSQQGTKLAMSQELCNNILEKGFFQPFSLKSQERQREQEENRRQRRQNNLQHVSDETAPPADSSPFVGAMTYQPPELSASPTLNQ